MQHFSRSTRFNRSTRLSHLCTARDCKYRKKFEFQRSKLLSALSLVDEPLPFSDLGDKAVLSGAAERRSLAELCAAKNAAQQRRASNERFMASRRAPRRPPQRLQSPASSTASTFLAAFGRSEGGAERASQRRASGSRDRASHPGSRASSTRSRKRGQGQGLSKPRLPSRPASAPDPWRTGRMYTCCRSVQRSCPRQVSTTANAADGGRLAKR